MSAGNTTDIWAWVHEDMTRLEAEGGARQAIVNSWREFNHYHYSDFAAAEHAINTAIDAAQATGEPRWELFLRHWRLQLWLNDDLKRALPEAVDLISLAEDEKVRDVPQRICAYHDIVDCHKEMDAVGYHDDIVANSEHVLAQLPRRHQCADCARIHLARAACAVGDSEATERWIARFRADADDTSWSAWPNAIGEMYVDLGKWDEAEQSFQQACENARKRETSSHYLEGLLGLTRARIGKGDIDGALRALREARHMGKYTGGRALLAQLLEVEGYLAEVTADPAIAIDYFTHAARQYLQLARYRTAALVSLHAAESARSASLPDAEEACDIAARAVGNMPSTSRDVYQRLVALGQQPVSPSRDNEAPQADSAVNERATLEDTLATHTAHGNLRGVAMTIYRLGRWHIEQKQYRAALDYLIANAVLERILGLTMNDREDALGALAYLQKQLPEGSVQAALAAAESGPPATLAELLSGMPPARWRWLVRCVATEMEDRPVVEPEPEPNGNDGESSFEYWLDHIASMTALVTRFRSRADTAGADRWATAMRETASEMGQQLGPNGEGREVVALVRAFEALSAGESPEAVAGRVQPPVKETVEQVIALAGQPVWQHPGCWPLDFLVENAAQRAVRSLRMHDVGREERLQNLAFRYELMALDLREEEELQPIARFLDALRLLVLSGGSEIPASDPPLDDPFPAVLAAVQAAGRAAAESPADV